MPINKAFQALEAMEWQGGYLNYPTVKRLLDAPTIQMVIEQRQAFLHTPEDQKLEISVRADWIPNAVVLPNGNRMLFSMGDGLVCFRRSSRSAPVAVGHTAPDYAPLIRACHEANEAFGAVYDIELMSAEAFHLQQCLTTVVKCHQYIMWMGNTEGILWDGAATERCSTILLALLGSIVDRTLSLLQQAIPGASRGQDTLKCPICKWQSDKHKIHRVRQHLIDHMLKPVAEMSVQEANFCQVLDVSPSKPFPSQLVLMVRQLLPACERLLNFGLLHKSAFEILLTEYQDRTHQQILANMLPSLTSTSLVQFHVPLLTLMNAIEDIQPPSKKKIISMGSLPGLWDAVLLSLAVALVAVGDSWELMRIAISADAATAWAFLVLVLLSLGAAAVTGTVAVWTWRRVFYAFILKLLPSTGNLRQFVTYSVWFWCITFVGFNQYILRRQTQAWAHAIPWITVALCAALTLLPPSIHGWRRVLWGTLVPLKIKLREILIWEWAVSLIPILYQYQFWFCAWPDIAKDFCPCSISYPPILATLTSIPICYRVTQDVILARRFSPKPLLTLRNPHLSSAIRYCLTIACLILQIVNQELGYRTVLQPTVAALYIFSALAHQYHEWRWDFRIIQMSKPGANKFLPIRRHYPIWAVQVGAVLTFLLRVAFVVTSFAFVWIQVRPMDWWWAALVLFCSEVTRRMIWSLIKLEAEELFNVSGLLRTEILPLAPHHDSPTTSVQRSAFMALMPEPRRRSTTPLLTNHLGSWRAWTEGGLTLDRLRETGGSLYRHLMAWDPSKPATPEPDPKINAVSVLEPQEDRKRRRDTVETTPWGENDSMFGSEASSVVEGEANGPGFPIASCYFLPTQVACCVDSGFSPHQSLSKRTIQEMNFLGELAQSPATDLSMVISPERHILDPLLENAKVQLPQAVYEDISCDEFMPPV